MLLLLSFRFLEPSWGGGSEDKLQRTSFLAGGWEHRLECVQVRIGEVMNSFIKFSKGSEAVSALEYAILIGVLSVGLYLGLDAFSDKYVEALSSQEINILVATPPDS